MSFKDSNENLILAEKLIETGNEEKAVFFIDKVIAENNGFINRFFSNSILSKAVFLKLKIVNDSGDKPELKRLFSSFSDMTLENNEALLIYRKIALSDDFFSERHAFNYVSRYSNDKEMISFFVDKIISLSLFKKKYIDIFKRYCLQFKKDYKILEITIEKIFEYKAFDLKFITIMLNYFYYFNNKDEKFEQNIFKFVDVFIKKYRYFHRKVFYPVFRFYYEKRKDKDILPFLFSIIKRNRIYDDFAQKICESMLEDKKKDSDIISVLSGIYRAKNRVDEKALSIYSRLYDIEPKDFDNTKYLAKVLRDNNDISSHNIDIFLKAQKLFAEKEKESDEYRNLIEFLGNYLSREKKYNKEYRYLVEDILRICKNNEIFLYCVNFYKFNKEYDKAFFLLRMLDHEKLDDLNRLEFYELFAEVFFSISHTKNFLDYNWKKVFNYLKVLKKSSKHKAAFLISQYYILRKNRNRLPVCFFSPGECERWSEKCLFMNKIAILKKSLLSRELNVIKEYCRLSDHTSAELFRKIFIEDNLYIPIDFSVPLSVCANIQKLISKDRFEDIFSLFHDNPGIIEFKGFIFWAGVTFFHLKKFDDSIIFFTKVINSDSTNPNAYAYYYRGMSFYKKGNLRVSVIDFEKVLELKFNNERIIEEILQIYIKHKYLKEANRICDNFYSIDGAKEKARYYKAEIFFIKKKYEESRKIVEELNELDFSQEKVRLLEIKILYELKDYETALKKSNRFVEKFSDNKDIYFQRALINIELKNYRLVKKDLEKYDNDIPERYYYIMASASFNSGDIDEAFNYINKYREKAFFEIRSNLLLSRIYLKKNLGKEALKILKFTWFFSKNRKILKELAITNKVLGNNNVSFDYAKKYIHDKGFDEELFIIVLEHLIKNNSLHSLSDNIEKYYRQETIYTHEKLRELFRESCYITGRFDILAERFEETDEIIIKNKNAEKSYFISRSFDDKFDIFITRGNIRIFQLENQSFLPEFFDDDIDYIFYCNTPRDVVGRLRYFASRVYSLNSIFLVFRPDFYPSEKFSEITDTFFNTVEYIRKLTPAQKNLVYLTGIFDDILLEFFDIYPVRQEYSIINEEIKTDNSLELPEIIPDNRKNKKILCRMKLRFWEENLRILSDSSRKEFYLVCLWENLNYSFEKNMKQYKYKKIVDFNNIQFFYENIDCIYCDKCNFNCQLNRLTDNVRHSFYTVDALKTKDIQYKLKNINDDFIMFQYFYRDFFDISEYIELNEIYIDILTHNEVFYKYDRRLFIDYRECIDIMRDLNKNIRRFSDFFSTHREIVFSLNHDMKKNSFLIYNSIQRLKKSLDYIIKSIEESNIRAILLDFLIRHFERFEKFIFRMNNTPFILSENINGNISVYAKDQNNSFKALQNNKSGDIQKKVFNRINSLRRLMSLIKPLENRFLQYEEEFYINKENILSFLAILKNNHFVFNNIDLRLILLTSVYLKEMNGKSSVIVWKNIKLNKNIFFSLGNDFSDMEYATLITDDIKNIPEDIAFNNIYVMNKVNIKLPLNLKYEKLFVYSKKEKNRNEDFTYLRIEKNELNIIKQNKDNSEKNSKDFELDVIDNNIITDFFNSYLNGSNNDIIVKDSLVSLDFLNFTDMNFNVYKNE